MVSTGRSRRDALHPGPNRDLVLTTQDPTISLFRSILPNPYLLLISKMNALSFWTKWTKGLRLLALIKAVNTITKPSTLSGHLPRVSNTLISARPSSTQSLSQDLRPTPFPEPASRPRGCHDCQSPHSIRDHDWIKEDLIQRKFAMKDYPGTTFVDWIMGFNTRNAPLTRVLQPPASDAPLHIRSDMAKASDVLYINSGKEKDMGGNEYKGQEEEELLSMVIV